MDASSRNRSRVLDWLAWLAFGATVAGLVWGCRRLHQAARPAGDDLGPGVQAEADALEKAWHKAGVRPAGE